MSVPASVLVLVLPDFEESGRKGECQVPCQISKVIRTDPNITLISMAMGRVHGKFRLLAKVSIMQFGIHVKIKGGARGGSFLEAVKKGLVWMTS